MKKKDEIYEVKLSGYLHNFEITNHYNIIHIII